MLKVLFVVCLIMVVTISATGAEDGPVFNYLPVDITHRSELAREYSIIHYGETLERIVPQAVVVHWTASDSCEGTYQYFKPEETYDEEMRSCGKLNVTAHFLVDRDGTIYQLTDDNLLNRHAIGLNWCAIGIENVGGVNNQEDLTDQQLRANETIIRHLVSKYSTIKYVLGHYQQDYAKTIGLWRENIPDYYAGKPDPGPIFMGKLYSNIKDLPVLGFPLQ